MTRVSVLCLPALLHLSACVQPNETRTVYVAPPEVHARADGQARGFEFATARACGAKPAELRRLADREPAPPVATPELRATYQDAFKAAFDASFTGTQATCDATRRSPEFGRLIPGQPRASDTQQAQLRTSGRTPAYCPAGSLAASMAPSMNEGIEILRARCKPGDSLLIERSHTGLIASVCDLGKPISPVSGDMLCTMGLIREMRQ